MKWGYEELQKPLQGNSGFWTILQEASEPETNLKALKIREEKMIL